MWRKGSATVRILYPLICFVSFSIFVYFHVFVRTWFGAICLIGVYLFYSTLRSLPCSITQLVFHFTSLTSLILSSACTLCCFHRPQLQVKEEGQEEKAEQCGQRVQPSAWTR